MISEVFYFVVIVVIFMICGGFWQIVMYFALL